MYRTDTERPARSPNIDWRYDMGDSEHEIIDVGLPNGARLHRFNNAGGIPYSAIYEEDFEVYSTERNYERRMIESYKKLRG